MMKTKRGRVGLIAAGVLAMLLFAAYASAADDDSAAVQNQIRVELEKWKLDFNAGDASQVCTLFAPDLISNFRGQPEDTYNSLCANLQAALTDPAKTYHYDLEIKEILVSGDLAVVRLVWTLKVHPKDGGIRRDDPRTRHGHIPPPARRKLENIALHGLRGAGSELVRSCNPLQHNQNIESGAERSL